VCVPQGQSWKPETYNSLSSCGETDLAHKAPLVRLALIKYGTGMGQMVKFQQRTTSVIECPQQGNLYDCSVFTGAFAAATVHGIDISAVQQASVPLYRTQWTATLKKGAASGIQTTFTPAVLGAVVQDSKEAIVKQNSHFGCFNLDPDIMMFMKPIP